MVYSDNYTPGMWPNLDGSYDASIDREGWFDTAPIGALRRIDDTAPCPLVGMPFIWSWAFATGPYTVFQAADIGSSFPLATAGSSTPPYTNIWMFHFDGVPRGKYAFYASASVGFLGYTDAEDYSETNAISAGINVVSSADASPWFSIISPTNGSVLQAGQPVAIRYSAAAMSTAQSLLHYAVYADGVILTNKVFNWNTQTSLATGSVTWTPTSGGAKSILIIGTDTECQTQNDGAGNPTVTVTVVGASNNVPAPFFQNQAKLANSINYLSFPNGQIFGYYSLQYYPWVYHLDMGWEYFLNAGDASNGGYLYDGSSGTFFYTAPNLFPYLYDFSLKAWLYYSPDATSPGHYTSNPRYFYNYSTGKWITK